MLNKSAALLFPLALIASNALSAMPSDDPMLRRITIVRQRDPALAQTLDAYAQAIKTFAASDSKDQAVKTGRVMDRIAGCAQKQMGQEEFVNEQTALMTVMASNSELQKTYDFARALRGAPPKSDVSACPESATLKPIPQAWMGCDIAERYVVTSIHEEFRKSTEVTVRFELDGREEVNFMDYDSTTHNSNPLALRQARCRSET